MLDITDLRKLAADIRQVIISQHVMKRFGERHINIGVVISVINCGEIIEQYPDDYPYPSCLILGMDCNEKNMHIVCGTNGDNLWIITAYYSSEDKWESDLKTRRV